MRAMLFDRRRLLIGSLTGAAAFTTPARGATLSVYGLDAVQLGVRANATDDQSAKLQRAIDRAAQTRVPLILGPGLYRAGGLKLPAGAQLLGVRGATRIAFTRGASLLSAEHAVSVTLSGLTLDGGGRQLGPDRGLVHLDDVHGLRLTDCEILRAGGNGIALGQCDGTVTGTTITGAADNALFCNDSRGMIVSANIIRGSGNGGIRIWQSRKRRDGSVIAGNRIEDTAARAGGSGQNGNAINVFRAGNVIVRNNVIRGTAFSAIRGAAASGIQILGNNCTALDEVAIYSEFDYEGAVIAGNTIEEAGNGISCTNFKEGGRLATVHGNLVRNCRTRRPGAAPQDQGVGIAVEADTAITGNTVENADTAGIALGWGEYLRDVTVTGNVVRACGIGVAVSVAKGAGNAVIAGNMLSRSKRGAILGMEWRNPVSGDLALSGADHYPQLIIRNNQVS
jgi:uncharacterized secreted repeat protein (TIGR03808 family)